jgi:hypothetical protein
MWRCLIFESRIDHLWTKRAAVCTILELNSSYCKTSCQSENEARIGWPLLEDQLITHSLG